MKSIWSVYLLTNGSRTYVGCTTDPARRLRQHNGELRGGARATRKQRGGKWSLCLYVTGFRGRSEACTWEALVKKRARGLRARCKALHELVLGVCPPGRKEYKVPNNLKAVLLLEITNA